MNYIVAVSGGVDSVVLLHQLVRAGRHRLVVAHVNHGMRPEADADARFVAGLARQYGLPYEEHRAALGEDASEEAARQARYDFLFAMAQRHDARVVTAHHADDVVETVALNLRRGTRWRGLAAMSDERIARPLKNRTKSELMAYAAAHGLEWVEDETNRQDQYTRNQLRRRLARLPQARRQAVWQLWRRQTAVRREIDELLGQLTGSLERRYLMIMLEPMVARELLAAYVTKEHGASLLSRQLDQALLAIKVGRPGTVWQIGQGLQLRLTKKEWYAEPIKQ